MDFFIGAEAFFGAQPFLDFRQRSGGDFGGSTTGVLDVEQLCQTVFLL